MTWLDPALSRLIDGDSQMRELALELQRAWLSAAEHWRDGRAREFEQKFVDPLPAAFSQAASAIAEFGDAARRAAVALDDPDRSAFH